MMRVVVDTNVLVGSAYNAESASRRIVDACLAGRLTLIVSPAVRREYRHILARAVRDKEQSGRLDRLIDQAEAVVPAKEPRVVPEDPQDDKFVAAGIAAAADAIISNDVHLLTLGSREGIPVLRPSEFLGQLRDSAKP